MNQVALQKQIDDVCSGDFQPFYSGLSTQSRLFCQCRFELGES
jgi:hypothetical protein